MRLWICAALSVAALLSLNVQGQNQPAPPAPDVLSTSGGEVRVERLAALEFPWGMAYTPDGRLLITEKPGRLRIFANGRLSEPVGGLPQIYYSGKQGEQGGLLDVAVDPKFSENKLVYLSYTEAASPQPEGMADLQDSRFGGYLDLSDNILRGGAVARGTLEGNQLRDVQVIWRQVPKTVGRGHFGHRLVFAPDGKLFITSGERMRFDPAQMMSSNLGKVVRINSDGSIPSDNPFRSKADTRGDIWSLGHRNMLAAVVNPTSGRLWVFEMGPLGGDEINIIEPGKNYGWPVVSNGDNYDSSVIPDHPSKKDFVAPLRTWTPVVSPSGALVYNGSMFPGWRGNIIVGGLSSMALVRLTLDGNRIAGEERINTGRRNRDLIEAPDGAILVITDDKSGELLRLTPRR